MKLINKFRSCSAWSRIFSSTSRFSNFLKFSTQRVEASGQEDTPWKSVVGLEIHAQILSHSKLFSSAGANFNVSTNSQVSFFDASLPGTMPVCNRHCIEAGILTALALNCTIHEISFFDRKHYFYSDLPAGYQITQQFHPLATNGYIEFFVYDSQKNMEPYKCKVRLKQLQLEQDSGRSFHIEKKQTLIDLNRAGIGLMELVFEPDITNGLEASMLVKELQLILKKLKTCSCVMQEGALRVDANISVHKEGMPYGVRTEVKNINSNKFIQEAVDYEIKRQIDLIENGQTVSNETRSYDYKAKKTQSMRDKEELQDYRFLPEPNLPAIQVCKDDESVCNPNQVSLKSLREKMPRLPADDRQFLASVHKLSVKNIENIIRYEGLLDFYDRISPPCEKQDKVIHFLLNNVKHQLNERKQTFQTCEISSDQVKDILNLLVNGVVSDAIANGILEMVFNGDKRSPEEIAKTYKWVYIKDEDELRRLCECVIQKRCQMAKKFKNTRRSKYLDALLSGVYERTNHRVAQEDAVAMFKKLLNMEEKPSEEQVVK